ncbi:MAG TPA: tetratricopeptide repeat protein [Verrucomicrobiae bacterium]|nr:tetratricopeptide repeat protein [Verrucomicrobiae bacterium]
MLGFIINDLLNWRYYLDNPVALIPVLFQLWMLVDAVRREEWAWAVFIFVFPVLTAVFYFFMVYRASPSATRGFELPGAGSRRRIKELQAQIHHLDKAHHHLELGDVYFRQGKLAKAEASYRAALERDAQDIDIRAHLGQCLLRLGRAAEAKPLLEKACAENPKHDFGYSLMALAEAHTALQENDQAVAVWRRVLADHAYARARVQLASLLIARGERDAARDELRETLADDAHAPHYQRRRDKVWIRQAKALLRQLS